MLSQEFKLTIDIILLELFIKANFILKFKERSKLKMMRKKCLEMSSLISCYMLTEFEFSLILNNLTKLPTLTNVQE